jgi:hypothetical protein
MAEVTEQAEQDDPKALRRKIARMEHQLNVAEADYAGGARVRGLEARIRELEARPPEIAEVPVLTEDQAKTFLAAMDHMSGAVNQMTDVSAVIRAALDRASSSVVPAIPAALPAPSPRARSLLAEPPPKAPASDGEGDVKIGKAHRAILAVLARDPEHGLDRQALGMLTVYSPGAGHFGNAISDLRKAGLIEPGKQLRISAAGITERERDYRFDPPTGQDLTDAWLSKVSSGEHRILRALLEAWPGSLGRAEIAEQTGYSAGAGHFGNMLGHLRSTGLITGTAAAFTADETLGREAVRTYA